MQDSENLIIFFSTCMISLKVEKGGKRHRSVSYIHDRYLLLMIKLFEKQKLYIAAIVKVSQFINPVLCFSCDSWNLK